MARRQKIASTVVKGYAMRKVGMGFVGLLMLSACGGAEVLPGATMADGHAEAVCNQQSDWARSGKVDGGNITITCPGYGRPTQSYAQN